jgi:hypothetical protein
MENETTQDPLGRTVHLTPRRWDHIVYGHPYMSPYRDDVIRAIAMPTDWFDEPRPGQAWYYLRGVGPSLWLKVVVAYDDKSTGSVKTAFPRRRKP